MRLRVFDKEQEVAFETALLGALRPGYRCFEMRSRNGTKIELCKLLVHIDVGYLVDTQKEQMEVDAESDERLPPPPPAPPPPIVAAPPPPPPPPPPPSMPHKGARRHWHVTIHTARLTTR